MPGSSSSNLAKPSNEVQQERKAQLLAPHVTRGLACQYSGTRTVVRRTRIVITELSQCLNEGLTLLSWPKGSP
jgi:hypothetical protein